MADPKGASPHDTAKFSVEEILSHLEKGRVFVRRTEAGSRLETAHEAAPPVERRHHRRDTVPSERRKYQPMEIPTLFPEKGPILLLLVGGFADERSIQQPLPFWQEDRDGTYLLWQALRTAGLLHKKDGDLAMGRGGFWDDHPPRTHGLAMTYTGFSPKGETVDFERITRPWNLDRLQTLIYEAHNRSMGKLKVVTIGNAARVMACAAAYGLPDVPVLSISAPSPETLDALKLGKESAAQHWVEWAGNVLAVGKD